MMAIRKLGIITSIMLAFGICNGQSKSSNFDTKIITTSELTQWRFFGKGELSTWGDQLALKEAADTKGVMLLSPESYTGDIIVSYKVMALTPATVIVTLLAVSDLGESESITIPERYDGGIELWSKEKENYFIAFKNASHNYTPFIQKNPNAKESLASAKENIMNAGVYYSIEVGRQGGKIWLSIDGKRVVEANDDAPLLGGHIAIRLRGTAGFIAGCLIKDMKIKTIH
jgi:hypothetical protein